MRGSGATCLRDGRTPTVPRAGGCVGHGAARGPAGSCQSGGRLWSATGAGTDGQDGWGCFLAVAGAPSLFEC